MDRNAQPHGVQSIPQGRTFCTLSCNQVETKEEEKQRAAGFSLILIPHRLIEPAIYGTIPSISERGVECIPISNRQQ
jgi:hypothetical protein